MMAAAAARWREQYDRMLRSQARLANLRRRDNAVADGEDAPTVLPVRERAGDAGQREDRDRAGEADKAEIQRCQ